MIRTSFVLTAAALSAMAAASSASAQVSVQTSGGSPVIASYFVIGHCLDVGNGNVIMHAPCAPSRGAQGWRFVSGSYGMISLGNQTCLTGNGSGQPLTAAQCANNPAQRWGIQTTGELRNETGVCADIEGRNRAAGGRIVGWSCNGGQNQKWYAARVGVTATYRISASTMPGFVNQPVRAFVTFSGVSPHNIVAGGAGNIVAGGAGNIVAGGAGNIVAGGAGNLIAQGIVAGGAGNLIANDGASFKVMPGQMFR